jgi:hypothetical protein
MDAATGALLLAAPAATVSAFGAALPPGDDISMRFVGAFVGAVGLSYLLAAVRPAGERRANLIREMWATTALIRSVVAVFVATAVVAGRLHVPWAVVAATDAGIAAIQIAWLLRGGRP